MGFVAATMHKIKTCLVKLISDRKHTKSDRILKSYAEMHMNSTGILLSKHCYN